MDLVMRLPLVLLASSSVACGGSAFTTADSRDAALTDALQDAGAEVATESDAEATSDAAVPASQCCTWMEEQTQPPYLPFPISQPCGWDSGAGVVECYPGMNNCLAEGKNVGSVAVCPVCAGAMTKNDSSW